MTPPRPARSPLARRVRRRLAIGALLVAAAPVLAGALGSPAAADHSRALPGPAAAPYPSVMHATTAPALRTVAAVTALPAAPTDPAVGGTSTVTGSPPSDGSVNVNISHVGTKPSQSIVIILLLTVLSIAPALLVLCTSFTKVIVVLSLARNALGTQTIPPNQVLAGLALFLSLFIMSPTLSAMNHDGVQPYLHGQKTQAQALHDGVEPLREFMLKQTRKTELATMIKESKQPPPKTEKDVSFTTLVPAFVLSELKSAFIIGFIIFIPFLVIDLVVSSSLMSMGMMMLPPTLIALPFKLLLFVMVDGWGLITQALVNSYH